MTDLEMTRLCAEAMGYQRVAISNILLPGFDASPPFVSCSFTGTSEDVVYAPLFHDAQCMALVKSETLDVTWGPGEQRWIVGQFRFKSERGMKEDGLYCECRSQDLNRAVVECVAKMRLQATARG